MRRSFSLPTTKFRAAAALSATLMAALLAAPASALTISLDYDEDDSPSFDPNGSELMRIARAAADIWEWHILDDEEIHFDMSWDNLGGRLGEYHPSYVWGDSIDLVMSTTSNGAPAPWFFDPTPHQNEEFGPVTSKLLRDMDPIEADEAFAGPHIPVLEVGTNARALTGSPALGNFDLLTMVMHEMGHALGMNFQATDDDYDLDSADVGGIDLGAWEGPGYELVLESALMNDFIAQKGLRTFPSAVDILATHDQNGYTNFNLRRIDLLGGHSEDWNDTLNWLGGKTPEWFNDTFVRDHKSVRIESGLAEVRSLLVDENGSIVVANNSDLKVFNELRIGNAANGTRGELHVGNFSGTPFLDAGSVTVDNGLLHMVSQGAVASIRGKTQIAPTGTLMGAGQVEVAGELNNDGEISAGTFVIFGFAGDLYLRATGNGKLDLDGGVERTNQGNQIAFAPPGLAFPGGFNDEFGSISAVNGNLFVMSPLADSFNGTATIGAGRKMYFSQPWGFGGTLALKGGSTAAKAALLSGSEIQFGGTTTVEGIATIDAPLVTGQFTRINLRNGSRLNLVGHHIGPPSDILDYGGTFQLDTNSTLNVNLWGSSWALKRTLKMAAGSTVTGDDLVNWGRIEGAGQFAMNRLDNGGVVAPTGELRTTGGYGQSWMGKLEIDLAGLGQGTTYDVLRVAGDAYIDGGVEFTLAEGFMPAVGTMFEILTAANVHGIFPSLEAWAPADVEFSGKVRYQPGKVLFEVTKANFAADFNADGVVDAQDMAAWFAASNAGGPGLNGEGDADHDYDVDGADMLIVQRQLGRRWTPPSVRPGGPVVGPVGGGVISRVPEPGSATLALGGLVAAIAVRRRRTC
jgi:hypothetical protein